MANKFDKTLQVLGKALKTVSEADFDRLLEKCCNTLKNNGKIVVSGLGKNVPICDKFVGTMSSLGLNAAFLHTNSAVHGDMGIIRSDDVVIILTKSGETIESVYLARLLAERGTDLWLLSFEEKSTLTDLIPNHLIINLEHEGDMWNIMPNNSTTLNLIVLQNLAMCIAEKMELTLEDFKANHPGGHIGKILK